MGRPLSGFKLLEIGYYGSCSGPTTPAGAEVKAGQAGGAVIAAGDIAESDVVAVNITGIGNHACIGRASRPHGRTQAGATDLPPTTLAAISGAVVNSRARVGSRIQGNIRGGALAGAFYLGIPTESGLRGCGSFIAAAATAAIRPAGLTGKSAIRVEGQQGAANRNDIRRGRRIFGRKPGIPGGNEKYNARVHKMRIVGYSRRRTRCRPNCC